MAQVGQASVFAANEILDHILLDGAYTPASIDVALCTATPVDADTGASISEAAYTGYDRVAATGVDWNAAASGAKDNVNAITFPQSSSGPETEKAFAITVGNTPGAGDLLFWGMLASNVQVGYADAAADLIRAPAHGLSNGNLVVLDFDTAPTGLSRDTEYIVASVTADTFALSGTTWTTDGPVIFGVSQWIVVNSNITPQFNASQLTLRLF